MRKYVLNYRSTNHICRSHKFNWNRSINDMCSVFVNGRRHLVEIAIFYRSSEIHSINKGRDRHIAYSGRCIDRSHCTEENNDCVSVYIRVVCVPDFYSLDDSGWMAMYTNSPHFHCAHAQSPIMLGFWLCTQRIYANENTLKICHSGLGMLTVYLVFNFSFSCQIHWDLIWRKMHFWKFP